MNKTLLRNVTLELSLKSFTRLDDEFIANIVSSAVGQWMNIIAQADQVSFLLWTADGSEILEYRGQLEDPVEWAKYIGYANPRKPIAGDPEGVGLHSRSYLYTEKPCDITYADLKSIVRILKTESQALTGKKIRVGATFDPGPEFAPSQFKYVTHPEICLASKVPGALDFVCCYSQLNGDTQRYAGFPDGIPQGTSLGTFLGKQSQVFMDDLGFDYIWFSNGFGFGLQPWRPYGVLFDGETFDSQKANDTAQKNVQFWEDFRENCPRYRIETRGTNLSTGLDLSTDAVPVKRIYDGDFNFSAPPNSPWAAIDGDFGLELMGYMSHIAKLPSGESGFPFRFYTHDPWWLNSPWLDRYQRQPHDIYLPMSVSRVDEHGKIQSPDSIEFLAINDSYGRMPQQVPNEVIPHVLWAKETSPDALAPLVWVYPFDEYDEMCFGNTPDPQKIFADDWFMRNAINQGVFVNTVVSDSVFAKTRDAEPELYSQSLLLCPLPRRGSFLAKALAEHIVSGGKVLFYGGINNADPGILELVSLTQADEIEGVVDVEVNVDGDAIESDAYPSRINHRAVVSGGGCGAELDSGSDRSVKVVASYSKDGTERIAALVRRIENGNRGLVGWVRGTNSMSCNAELNLPVMDDPTELLDGAILARFVLSEMGYTLRYKKGLAQQKNTLMTISRHDNAFYFSGYCPDTTVECQVRLPHGAPVFLNHECWLKDNHTCFTMPRAWRNECRVFVDQKETSLISCVEKHSGQIGIERRILVSGLRNANVRFYFPQKSLQTLRIQPDPQWPFLQGTLLNHNIVSEADGSYCYCKGITGQLMFSW